MKEISIQTIEALAKNQKLQIFWLIGLTMCNVFGLSSIIWLSTTVENNRIYTAQQSKFRYNSIDANSDKKILEEKLKFLKERIETLETSEQNKKKVLKDVTP